jgi:bifunctional DNase/RNase
MPAGNQIVKVDVRSVVPTSGGAAVFLGGEGKVIVIYIDNVVGMAIMSAMRQEPRERPQTHDLINSILAGFGAKVDRVVINDFNSGVRK